MASTRDVLPVPRWPTTATFRIFPGSEGATDGRVYRLAKVGVRRCIHAVFAQESSARGCACADRHPRARATRVHVVSAGEPHAPGDPRMGARGPADQRGGL